MVKPDTAATLFYMLGKLIGHIADWIWCLRFPFWFSHHHNWYKQIPIGWRKAFGKQLSVDLKKALKQARKHHSRATIQWQSVEEHLGALSLVAVAPAEVAEVLYRYGSISTYYCAICGEPAVYPLPGRMLPVCKHCWQQVEGHPAPHNLLDVAEKEER